MTTLLVTHPACLDHLTPPGHPERPDRLRAIEKALADDDKIIKDASNVMAADHQRASRCSPSRADELAVASPVPRRSSAMLRSCNGAAERPDLGGCGGFRPHDEVGDSSPTMNGP